MVIHNLNVFGIIFQGKTRALRNGRDNNLELLNEWFVNVAGLHTILFSDFVPDQEVQYTMGYCLNFTVYTMIAINLYFILLSVCNNIRLILKKQYIAWSNFLGTGAYKV